MDTDTSLTFRLADLEEAPIIASLLHRAFIEYEPLYTPAAFAATTPTTATLQQRWDEGPVWVALAHDHIVGTVAAVPKATGLYVRSMAVHPEARGHNVGHRLLEYMETFARQLAAPRLYLSTTPFLQRAIRLYERFGFARTDEGPLDLHGTPLFTMEKWLV